VVEVRSPSSESIKSASWATSTFFLYGLRSATGGRTGLTACLTWAAAAPLVKAVVSRFLGSGLPFASFLRLRLPFSACVYQSHYSETDAMLPSSSELPSCLKSSSSPLST
jgi:hypothetical protein